MDYEKAYKESLGRAIAQQETYLHLGNVSAAKAIENIFPELRESESEDERIRKSLIRNFTNQHSSNFPTVDGFTREQILAWLERQGEQKPADKIESKFKVGDWVVKDDSRIFSNGSKSVQVTNIDNKGHIWFTTGTWLSEDDICLWTIEDAKDGDVLVTDSGRPFIFMGCLDERHPNSPVAYCGIDSVDCFFDCNGTSWWTDENVYPATEEQRDILFQKMKEAGYEWDDEKKELKKLEQTSAWSEEDEERIDFLFAICDDEQAECVNNSTMYRECTETKDWLKSLKDRVQPQPKQRTQKPALNEDDKEQLDRAIYMMEQLDMTKSWDDVYNWLKSIKDRVQPQPKKR